MAMKGGLHTLSNHPRWVCCVISAMVILFVGLSGMGHLLDLQIANLLFQKVGTRFKPSREIEIVVIDDASLAAMEPVAGRWPWPRSWLGNLVRACEGAACVGIDLLLLEPDRADAGNDKALAVELHRHGHVAIAGMFQDYPLRDASAVPSPLLQRSLVPGVERDMTPVSPNLVSQFLMPLPVIAQAASRVGHANFFPSADHLLRSYPYFLVTDQGTVPSLAVATLMAASRRSLPSMPAIARYSWRFANSPSEMVFYREPFVRHSAAELLLPQPSGHSAAMDDRHSATNRTPQGGFVQDPSLQRSAVTARGGHAETIHVSESRWASGKVILIGLEARGLHHTRATPLQAEQSSLDIHATALSNWLQRIRLLSPSALSEWLLACLFGIFPLIVWKESNRLVWISGGLLLVTYHAMGVAAFYLIPLRLPWAMPVLAFVSASVCRLGDAFVRERALRRRLEDLQRAKQTFSNMLVHDLNAPVSNMIMLLESILPAQTGGSKDRRRMENALAEGHHMSDLLHTLLDIQRMESGRMELVCSRFRWEQLVDETAARLTPHAERRNLIIRASHAEHPLEVHGDSTLLRRVLINLLENAIQHGSPGSEVLCRTRTHESQPAWLTCQVVNRGPILDPKDQAKLFEPFTQIHRSEQANERSGFGLGVAFCKLAVAAHGGGIRCISPAPGWPDGVAFEFSLPLEPGKEAHESRP